MSEYVEYNPKAHGRKPPYWTPDMPTSLDGKNFVRQSNWAWISGTTYYVPREAVFLPKEEDAIKAEVESQIVAWLRDNVDGDCSCQACFMHRSIADAIENGEYKQEQGNDKHTR